VITDTGKCRDNDRDILLKSIALLAICIKINVIQHYDYQTLVLREEEIELKQHVVTLLSCPYSNTDDDIRLLRATSRIYLPPDDCSACFITLYSTATDIMTALRSAKYARLT